MDSSETAEVTDDMLSRGQTLYSNKETSTEEAENPLILASKNGHLEEVRYLIEETRVDINLRGIFRANYRINPIYCTALHAAVLSGQLQVIDYLVNCNKLDIDAQTKALFQNDPDGGSTALHLAVSHLNENVNQKEIVTCLLEMGADWAIVNDIGYQCWERAFDEELAKLLIDFGVGLDSSRNAKSSNIVHMWAKIWYDVYSGEVVARAMERGVNINEPDVDGLTPLMIAAIGEDGEPNRNVFDEILNQKVQPVSRFDRIIALELIGATYISDEHDPQNGIKYLKMAMELRFNVQSEPIPKPPTALTYEAQVAFKDTCEVQTMEELMNVAHDLHSLRVQAHLIRIRILGLKHRETMRCLTSYAIFIWNLRPQTFLNYCNLILTNFEYESSKLAWFHHCAKFFALSVVAMFRISKGMVAADDAIGAFQNAMPILRKLISLLSIDSELNPGCTSFILNSIVDVVHVLLDDNKPLTLQESFDLKRCLHQAVRLQKRNTKGLDLFLLSCSDHSQLNIPIESECLDGSVQTVKIYYRRHVSAKTVSIFIEVGSDLESVSNNGDTGLHVLANNIGPKLCTSSIKMLFEAGVHLDQTNAQGKTMLDRLRDRGIKIESSIIPDDRLRIPLLKCLCARILSPFPSVLSEIHHSSLAKFVMWHRFL